MDTVGIGLFILIVGNKNSNMLIFGIVLVIIGIIQLLRKIKTFQLTKNQLIIKRPLLPFKIAEDIFELQKINLIEFKKVIKVGSYIKITGKLNGKDGGYMLAIDKQSIDLFENELRNLGVKVSREKI